MRAKPTCRRCQRQHYNMEPCAVARPPEIRLRPRATDFGNRLDTLVSIAPGVVGRRRAPMHGSRPAA